MPESIVLDVQATSSSFFNQDLHFEVVKSVRKLAEIFLGQTIGVHLFNEVVNSLLNFLDANPDVPMQSASVGKTPDGQQVRVQIHRAA